MVAKRLDVEYIYYLVKYIFFKCMCSYANLNVKLIFHPLRLFSAGAPLRATLSSQDGISRRRKELKRQM